MSSTTCPSANLPTPLPTACEHWVPGISAGNGRPDPGQDQRIKNPKSFRHQHHASLKGWRASEEVVCFLEPSQQKPEYENSSGAEQPNGPVAAYLILTQDRSLSTSFEEFCLSYQGQQE